MIRNVTAPLLLAALAFSPLASADTATERLFNWAEAKYSDLFPSSQTTQTADGWTYRHYALSGIYLGVNSSNEVYVMGGQFGSSPALLGELDSYTSVIEADMPTAPTDVHISAVFGVNSIIWEMDNNHPNTEIWRANGLNASVDDAELQTTKTWSMYSGYQIEEGAPYTYWIRFVSDAGIEGPWHDENGTSLTSKVSVSSQIEDISSEIDELISDSLNTPIDPIQF